MNGIKEGPHMITIGIPAYERTKYIKGALESCLRQSGAHFEILINDTSNNDEIRQIADSLNSPKIRYLRNPVNTPVLTKFNQLVAQGRGDWMLILCDDDLLDPDYLSSMAVKMRQYPQATLFRSRYKLIDTEGRTLRLDNNCKEFMSAAEFLSRVFMPEKDFYKMNISGVLFPRELFLKLGGFPELPLAWHSDRLAWAILGGEGGCVFEERPLCSVRLHPGSITSSFNKKITSALESDLGAKRIFEGVLEKVGQSDLSKEDRRYLAEARKQLKIYMSRHLTRSLDHGFIANLSEKSKARMGQFQALIQQMKELQIGHFPSLPFYYVLSRLPFALREPLLVRLKDYKIRKWCA